MLEFVGGLGIMVGLALILSLLGNLAQAVLS
jgi:hypothetical protein